MNDYNERFSGVISLIGMDKINILSNANVCLIGLGGVGSWVAEALARCGVGRITIVDFDVVSKTNVNRQIHSLDGDFNKTKVQSMAERILRINPYCIVKQIHSFFTYSNADEILYENYSYVIDAMDSPSKKCLLADKCKKRGIPLIMTGAAGGKIDPTMVKIADLSEVYNDRLLQEVRKKLRAKYGFPGASSPMGIDAVFSIEPAKRQKNNIPDTEKAEDSNFKTGVGTVVFVTAVFGFAASSRVFVKLTGIETTPQVSDVGKIF